MGFEDLGIGSLIGAGASIYGGIENRASAERIAQQNIANQRDFAQHGISWRVADARSAGISPLAALGASTSSFSNVVGSDSFGEGIKDAGQDIGKAVKSWTSAEDKTMLRAGAKLDIESKELDNEIKRAELASKIAKEGPAVPNVPGFAPAPGGVEGSQGDVWKGGAQGFKFSDLYGNKATPLIVGGRAFDPSRRFSDSNQAQNRWGDTIQDIIAPFALDEDMRMNMGQRIPEFLWKWANEGATEGNKWLWNNRWDVIDAIRKGAVWYNAPLRRRGE